MKKNILTTIVVLIMAVLTACGQKYERKISQMQAEVIACEEVFCHPNQLYVDMAMKHEEQKNRAMSRHYMQMAYEYAIRQYNVTVDLEGKIYNISRSNEYKTGEVIEIKVIDTYDGVELLERKIQ